MTHNSAINKREVYMKQVPMLDEVHDDLMKVVNYKKKLFPTMSITIKSVVAELIEREAKRVKRKEVK
jgi:hypothetical protein